MEYLEVNLSPKEHKRLFKKIKIDEKTGCWNWTGGKDQLGYGQGYYNHRRERIHRIIYAFFKGPIPRGKIFQIDHLCRNHQCCNPEHLELVTQQINIIRGEGITAINSRKEFCKHGHPLPPYKGHGRTCKVCDSIRHKKRMNGPDREYWLKKNREAVRRCYSKKKQLSTGN